VEGSARAGADLQIQLLDQDNAYPALSVAETAVGIEQHISRPRDTPENAMEAVHGALMSSLFNAVVID
jgi:hypothetical protein